MSTVHQAAAGRVAILQPLKPAPGLKLRHVSGSVYGCFPFDLTYSRWRCASEGENNLLRQNCVHHSIGVLDLMLEEMDERFANKGVNLAIARSVVKSATDAT